MSQSWLLYDTQNKFCSHLVNFFLNKLRILLYKPSTFEFRPTAQQKHLYTTLSNSLSAFFLSTTYTFVMYSSNPSAPQKYADAPTSGQAPVMGVPVNSYQPQAAPFQIQSSAPVPWSTGLCDCGDDVGNCCITCWCPCITFGQIAEVVDRGTTSCAASGALYALINLLTSCGCLYSCCYRSKMRRQHKLEESCCGDCIVHCCCERCALCQEYRELKHQGFDLSIGWQGNVEQQTRGVMTATAPVTQGGMNR